jgi:hypothetical protein
MRKYKYSNKKNLENLYYEWQITQTNAHSNNEPLSQLQNVHNPSTLSHLILE